MKDRAIGLGWLAGAGLIFVASAALTTAIGWLPAGLSVLGWVLGLLATGALWLFTARVLPNVTTTWREVLPGAIFGIVGLEILKLLGGVWVPRAVESSSSLYGTIGVVFAVLAWLLVFGKLIIYSAVMNVVFSEARAGTVVSSIQVPKRSSEQRKMSRSGQVQRH